MPKLTGWIARCVCVCGSIPSRGSCLLFCSWVLTEKQLESKLVNTSNSFVFFKNSPWMVFKQLEAFQIRMPHVLTECVPKVSICFHKCCYAQCNVVQLFTCIMYHDITWLYFRRWINLFPTFTKWSFQSVFESVAQKVSLTPGTKSTGRGNWTEYHS